MLPKKQTELFEQVCKRFPNWGKPRASGYVHGVVRGLSHIEPESDYIRRFMHMEEYAKGYFYGFLDAYGVDALTAEWFKMFFGSNSVMPIDYRWWQDESTTTNCD